MSQNDLNIANQGFPSFRSDLNDALQALGSNSSGASSPATTYAGQFWYDSTNDVLKFRNEANSAWIDPPIAGLVQALSDLGVTASAAELNKMDGVTASTAEINYIDGVTSNIQTQLGTKMPLAGGTFTGDITRGGTVIGDGAISDTGDFTIDVAGDIILDAGGQQIILKDDGTTFAEVYQASNDLYIESKVSDKDIFFRGNDGGSDITALTLDMSAAGAATFNSSVTATAFAGDGSGLTGVGGSTAYGAVGTYIMGYRYSTGITNASTYAGSSIEPGGFGHEYAIGDDGITGSFAKFTKGSIGLSGTWRAMGRHNGDSASNYARYTLYVRIS